MVFEFDRELFTVALFVAILFLCGYFWTANKIIDMIRNRKKNKIITPNNNNVKDSKIK